MKTGTKFLLLLAGLSLFISACGSGGGGGNVPSQPQAPPPPIIYDVYVDAVNGDDQNTGTESEPLKTITHALSFAGTNKSIMVLPGTYNTALGENFPLVLQEGQSLTGDISNRGSGATPTLIAGSGTLPGGAHPATIVGAVNSKVSGFMIGEYTPTDLHAAIDVNAVKMEISFNTFKTDTYGGVYFKGNGASVVKYNTFETDNYGVYSEDACTSCPTIRNNKFLTMDIPVHIHTYAVIRDNKINGNGQVGIETSGNPLIEGNTFSKSGAYTSGAIYLYDIKSIPKIRGNTFDCKTAVRVDNGNPDLGTASDPGNNDFSDVSGVSLTHNGTADIFAVGNTWPNPTPSFSTDPAANKDILITGGGSVKWGINEADIHPAP